MLKVICAWCGAFLSGNRSAEASSHGICRPCSEDVLAEAGIEAEWLDRDEPGDPDLGGEG